MIPKNDCGSTFTRAEFAYRNLNVILDLFTHEHILWGYAEHGKDWRITVPLHTKALAMLVQFSALMLVALESHS
jgi:hypothetical protein